jgi:hypothetical protein
MPINVQSFELPDAHLRKALAYWLRKCGERHMPRRADIDPVEMPELLPYVRLADVVAPGQYRYRLVGYRARANAWRAQVFGTVRS